MNQSRQLTEENLMNLVPSVFANNAANDVSDKYNFIPTIDIVHHLQKEGWYPTQAQEIRVRKTEYAGFQKHLIRFQRQDLLLGDEAIEVVLINSHNRSAAYQLHAGVFRFVCSNGMIVADESFGRLSVKHINLDPQKVVEASYEIINEAPVIAENISEMKDLQLTEPEKKVYAESAAMLQYESIEDMPFEPAKLLEPKRYKDGDANDLWRTFNIVQENVIKGGIRGMKKDKDGYWQRTKSRKVGSIDKNVKLNKALWHLTEQMKAMKA